MCSVLEHSLRLLWCRTNGRPRLRIARPSEYYVTLDGHGRRDRHDVLLAPYLLTGPDGGGDGDGTEGSRRNGMIPAIGADAHALLCDLFLSPSAAEAPNVRSALCHGRWDGEVRGELEGASTASWTSCAPATTVVGGGGYRRNEFAERRRDPSLTDAACAIVSCLDMIASNVLSDEPPTSPAILQHRTVPYQPVHTYTATAVRNLNEIISDLSEIDSMISNNPYIGDCARAMDYQRPRLCEDVRNLTIEMGVVKEMARDIFPVMTTLDDDKTWSVVDVYSEHRTNIALAGNIAALTLMRDASRCIERYVAGLRERKDILSEMEPSNTKDRRAMKTSAMFCSVAAIAREFYAFVVYLALIAVREKKYSQDDTTLDEGRCKNDHVPGRDCDRAEIVRMVERSRMTISTFDSHLTTNLERSMKAVEQYMQGKILKKLLHIKGASRPE
jgi:hypothetical protein